MKCKECPSYSRKLQRCSLGKINPQRWSKNDFKSTVDFMGLSYICSENKFKIAFLAGLLSK